MEENEQKKYIRTFAGDIRTVKRGGTPNLVPLDNAGSDAIKTYSGDFAERIKETQASTATILAAEQDAAAQPSMAVTAEEEPKKISLNSILYIIAGVVLLIIGITGSYIAYTRYLTAVTPISVAPSVRAPIFVDEREAVSGTGTALLRAIEQSSTRTLTAGTVRLLHFDPATGSTSSQPSSETTAGTAPQATTVKSVFSELRIPAPGVLSRNINADNSMAGIVNPAPSSVVGTGGMQSVFFILSVSSYGDTFAGMLSWEPMMPRDLAALFPSYAEGYGGQARMSTTTTSIKTATSTPKVSAPVAFRDEVVANHDVRVYRDAVDRSVLLYGYWNQTTLIIARDPEAFTEIAGRISTSRLPAQAGAQQ